MLVLIGLGSTATFWAPWVLQIAHTKKDAIEEVKKLLDLLAQPIGWLSAAVIFLYKLWREKKEQPQKPASSIAHNEEIGLNIIHTGVGSLTLGPTTGQNAGVNLASQRDVTVVGDVFQSKTEIHQVQLAPLRPLHQLPQPPADFQGRRDDLAELRAAMTGEKAMISGLQGQGGIGKTALALTLAAELGPAYPDGQIYFDLRGVSDNPAPTSEALECVVRSFHPEVKPPEKQTEMEALYRSVLHGKRALLLMDNARDAKQVAPLLPPQGCALLVTSRRHFTLPGLFVKELDTLPPSDAEALVLAIAPRIEGHAKAISELCGFLPQALRLAASTLANRKDLSPAEYVQQLGDEKNRLQLLKDGGQGDGGSEQGVEASIGLSYALLGEQTQERWRNLGVFPGTFDLPAAAAVWETEKGSAQDTLGVLLQYSMLEWNETSARYRLHDLMRDFARAHVDATELDEAARHHAIHYLLTLQSTDALYKRGGDALRRALDLFDAEWGNIQAGQAWAANHAAEDAEAAQLCSDYSDYGTFLLQLRQHPRERIRWREFALASARRLQDRKAEGTHLGNLGIAYHSLGEYRRAAEYYEQDLVISREIGDRRGESRALGNLGCAHSDLGECRRAIEFHEQELAVAREIGYRLGQGYALGNLGTAYCSQGEYTRAIEYLDQALTIAREFHDRSGEGTILSNLGIAYNLSGEYRRAIEFYRQAHAIALEIGDRQLESRLAGILVGLFYCLGEYHDVIEYGTKHLAIAREIGDRKGEADTLWNASEALEKLGERQKAVEHANAALQIYEEIESPSAEDVRKRLGEWQGGSGAPNK